VLQNPNWGGAERSLAETLHAAEVQPLLICPARGDWTAWAEKHGIPHQVVPRPSSLDAFTFRGQGSAGFRLKLLACLRAPWDVLRYAIRLHRVIPGKCPIRTLGIKSHLMGLCLLPWWKGRWTADIRDFIEPQGLRSLLAFLCQRGWLDVQANSQSVAKDYPKARVVYPKIRLPRPGNRRPSGEKRILAHLAFFAPYKGQNLFLECAADWLRQGLQAEFWMIGSVLYPAPEYLAYERELRDRASLSDLAGQVRFLSVKTAADVQGLLEQTDLLLHCSLKPEPFGRNVVEALACGAQVICHRDSGVCELGRVNPQWPTWLPPTALLTQNYVALEWTEALSACVTFDTASGKV
jgi:glycosyltransferase involved in cell wall biosynthesis